MDKIGANFRSIFKTPKEWVHSRYGQEQGAADMSPGRRFRPAVRTLFDFNEKTRQYDLS